MLNRVVIGVLLVALAAGAWQFNRAERLADQVAHEQEQLATMTAARNAWHERTMDALDQLGEARQRHRDAERAVAELQEALVEADADYQAIQQRIRQAPAEDDGAVAPVLRETLEALP